MRRTSSSKQRELSKEYVKGELLSFSIKGQDFWGVGEVRTMQNGGGVKVTGKLLGAKPGDTVELEGNFETNKWGTSFKVTSCAVVIPSDSIGVVGWLGAHLPHISKRRAEQLVERHGVEGVWRILEASDAAALCELDGITPPRAEKVFAAYRENRGERDRMVRLKQWGLTDGQIARVVAEWGKDVETRLAEDPYSLMECVQGFGWKRSDEVAQRMGVARDAAPRIGAGLLHAMKEASAAGHCFVPGGKLVALTAGAKVLGGVDEGAVRRVLEQLVEKGKLVRHGVNVYLPKLAAAEADLAVVFAERAAETRTKKEERAA